MAEQVLPRLVALMIETKKAQAAAVYDFGKVRIGACGNPSIIPSFVRFTIPSASHIAPGLRSSSWPGLGPATHVFFGPRGKRGCPGQARA